MMTRSCNDEAAPESPPDASTTTNGQHTKQSASDEATATSKTHPERPRLAHRTRKGRASKQKQELMASGAVFRARFFVALLAGFMVMNFWNEMSNNKNYLVDMKRDDSGASRKAEEEGVLDIVSSRSFILSYWQQWKRQVAYWMQQQGDEVEDDAFLYDFVKQEEDNPRSCRNWLKSQIARTTTSSVSDLLLDVLAMHNNSVLWKERLDESLELQFSACQLHRFTAAEARQCLADHHVLFIGDSLTRFQVTSLVHLLERGVYPPRFNKQLLQVRQGERPYDACTFGSHTAASTNDTSPCSPRNEPNVCVDQDYSSQPIRDKWRSFHYHMGGATDGGVFHGHMECDCARGPDITPSRAVENFFYASEPIELEKRRRVSIPNYLVNDNRALVSYMFEAGWGANPRPVRGATYFGDCVYNGTCRHNPTKVAEWSKRADAEDYAWIHTLQELMTMNATSNIRPLDRVLPAPVDVAIYNRGLWGALTTQQAQTLMPLFHNITHTHSSDNIQRRLQRCFFKSTTASGRTSVAKKAHEQTTLRNITQEANCGFYDLAEMTDLFRMSTKEEAERIFFDGMHFRPWAYEEFNNLLLNALCL